MEINAEIHVHVFHGNFAQIVLPPARVGTSRILVISLRLAGIYHRHPALQDQTNISQIRGRSITSGQTSGGPREKAYHVN